MLRSLKRFRHKIKLTVVGYVVMALAVGFTFWYDQHQRCESSRHARQELHAAFHIAVTGDDTKLDPATMKIDDTVQKRLRKGLPVPHHC